MKPALRLTWRLAPYMLFSLVVLMLVAFQLAALLLSEFHHASLITLLFTIYMVVICKMIVVYMGGRELGKELTARGGKPIKVFRPGGKNFRFLKTSNWSYEIQSCYLVLVNPRMNKFSFTKYLYLLDPSSEDFSNQLLEVAATNENAFEEIASKVRYGKYRASSDLKKFESATAISETIQGILN